MIVIVLLQIDLYPVHFAGELIISRVIVRRNGRAGSLADIAGFVCREYHRHRYFHSAFTDLRAIQVKQCIAALGQAAAIVFELHPHLVLTRWNQLV